MTNEEKYKSATAKLTVARLIERGLRNNRVHPTAVEQLASDAVEDRAFEIDDQTLELRSVVGGNVADWLLSIEDRKPHCFRPKGAPSDLGPEHLGGYTHVEFAKLDPLTKLQVANGEHLKGDPR